MTNTAAFDWRSFLLTWSEEWADSLPDDDVGRTESDEAALRARWLGFPGAPEERIVTLEERLGRRMPPSYREFLKVTDGWRHAGGFVWRLAGTAEAVWQGDASGLAEMFEEFLDEDAGPEERNAAEVWRRGIQLDVESDVVYVAMDPEDVDEDGEWAVYTWASWRAMPPERYPSFLAFMKDMYREFHSLRAHGREGWPEFVNDTTRALDARSAEAREEALRGGWERALTELDEAKKYGRPRAGALGDQLRRLLGRTDTADYEGLATDPRYAPELLPPLVAAYAPRSYGDDVTRRFPLGNAGEDVVAQAYATLDQVRTGTYRYAPGGPFGEALDGARELARWGDTDGAWRTLRDALPLWEPLGPDHLAPLGWVADPLLGPLLTPERGVELLSTPRGGAGGEARTPTPGLDPGGLAWLAESGPDGRSSYRFVLVEGVAPEELPVRLADGAVVHLPLTLHEARLVRMRHPGEFSSYGEGPLVAFGRAGAGWSFAFDTDPGRFDADLFLSPAPGASAGTRAVAVCGGLRGQRLKPHFHLSVARDGVEEYAFTYRAGEVRRSGEIPPALDPDRFFGDPADPARAERPLLDTVAAEFGAGLPRHALLNGRLHTFTTRSWTRPPRQGETVLMSRWMPFDGDRV
ncbi:SMI1/KNR4 family protein [Streptomyces sp. NPDC056049]|uniref:SMI1/KNR4 family protein n=1 Tax=Streptomyces sp. NPDC056049 TaxID=3345693 RepID=UPI0035DBF90B